MVVLNRAPSCGTALIPCGIDILGRSIVALDAMRHSQHSHVHEWISEKHSTHGAQLGGDNVALALKTGVIMSAYLNGFTCFEEKLIIVVIPLIFKPNP